MQEKKEKTSTPPKPLMSEAQLQEVARLFGILAEDSRLRLLQALMDSSKTVTELVEVTGMKQGNVSKHLGMLASVRFVTKTREGNFSRYSIADSRIYTLCELMCGRVAEDACARLAALEGE